jgi:hypothetical protein
MKPERPSPTCRSCGAAIRFVRGPAGKPIPVDREPDEELSNIIVEHGIATVLTTTQLVSAREAGYELYVSHFATCPSVDRHRRRDRAARAERREEAGQEVLFA